PEEVGFTKAIRELGYPSSWNTAKRWADLRSVTIAVDPVKASARAVEEWYKTEEIMLVAQEGIQRVFEQLVHEARLLPDDHKKLAEALGKFYDTWAKAQGKATTITESRTEDTFDARIEQIINAERAKNRTKSQEPVVTGE